MSDGYSGDLNKRSEDFKYHNLAIRIYPEKAKADPAPEWGCFIHPDEIRRVLMIGNEALITTKGTQFEDYQLKNWIDQTVQAFSDDIQWDIYPRLWRHRPVLSAPGGRLDISPTGEIESFAEWEDLYNFDSNSSSSFLVKLRRKPLCRLLKWVLTYPWNGSQLVNILEYATPKYKQGLLQALFVKSIFTGTATPGFGIQAWRAINGMNFIPNAYQIDYVSGYDHASRVPRELKDVIINIFLVNLLSAYGEGIIGGVSSYSTSVGIVSESLNTTMSAENAFFGARIKQLKDQIKEWKKYNIHKYTHVRLGFLG